MPNQIETGHAKNAGNFQKLISYCLGYGTDYNPNKAALKLPALNTKLADAKAALKGVDKEIVPWQNAVNAREIIFDPLSILITRVVAAVVSSEVTKQYIADVKTIARKLQGRRAKPKKPTTPDKPDTPVNESSKSISASQQSFDKKVENMNKLVELLTAESAYAPNETDLTVASLTTLLTSMESSNTDAINTFTPLSNQRISRDKIFYDEETGLVKIAGDVKSYVKSVFKATSPQYKQVSGLEFKIIKS